MTLASATVQEVLLLLKVLFLVLLYLFIWRVVRAITRDAGTRPATPTPPGPEGAQPDGKLVVLASPVLVVGAERAFDAAPVTIGRVEENDLALVGDDFASARHARFQRRRDGVYVEDVGSTNGTFVNGKRIRKARRLEPGDVVRVGETDLRFDR